VAYELVSIDSERVLTLEQYEALADASPDVEWLANITNAKTRILTAAPIQYAIDLARFMVETTRRFVRFAITRKKTVGGPIEIAAITKHEGFKWVQRKRFFSAE